MSRDITASFKSAVTSKYVRPFLLFQAFFDSETLRFWNGIGNMDYNGDTYTGAGHLLKLDQIDETTKVEAKGITLTLSGIPSALISVALQENYQDRKVTVDLGFFDVDDSIIPDPFRFFSGKADIMSILEGGETATISLTAENDLIILQRVNERRRTDEDQKLFASNDSFFEMVTALQNKSIVWGS